MRDCIVHKVARTNNVVGDIPWNVSIRHTQAVNWSVHGHTPLTTQQPTQQPSQRQQLVAQKQPQQLVAQQQPQQQGVFDGWRWIAHPSVAPSMAAFMWIHGVIGVCVGGVDVDGYACMSVYI